MKKLFSLFFGTKRRTVFTSVAILLLFTLVFCTAVMPFLQHGPVVLSYKGLNIRQGVFLYLYTFFRYKLPASSNAITDTDAFWRMTREDGQTNSDYYGQIALNLVFQVVAGARIYDSTTTLAQDERAELQKAIEETVSLSYKGGGSKKAFNENAKKFGFTYEDFKTATTLLYKATMLQSALYGETGSRMTEADLQTYLEDQYRHVLIIFIRTENKFVLDGEGNYLFNGNGEYMTEPLSPEESAAQAEKIQAVQTALSDGTDSEEFLNLLLEYNDDADAHKRLGSYYFSEGNAYTAAYEKTFPTVKETAMGLEIGEWGMATSSVGTHFIFRAEVGDAPYNDRLYEQFFGDLRSRAMDYLYNQLLFEGVAGVKTKDQAFLDGLDFGDTQPNTALMIAYFNGYTVKISAKE